MADEKNVNKHTFQSSHILQPIIWYILSSGGILINGHFELSCLFFLYLGKKSWRVRPHLHRQSFLGNHAYSRKTFLHYKQDYRCKGLLEDYHVMIED